MINFDDELRKFTESLEIDQLEDVVNKHDLTDVTDLLTQVVQQNKTLANQNMAQQAMVQAQAAVIPTITTVP